MQRIGVYTPDPKGLNLTRRDLNGSIVAFSSSEHGMGIGSRYSSLCAGSCQVSELDGQITWHREPVREVGEHLDRV